MNETFLNVQVVSILVHVSLFWGVQWGTTSLCFFVASYTDHEWL